MKYFVFRLRNEFVEVEADNKTEALKASKHVMDTLWHTEWADYTIDEKEKYEKSQK